MSSNQPYPQDFPVDGRNWLPVISGAGSLFPVRERRTRPAFHRSCIHQFKQAHLQGPAAAAAIDVDDVVVHAGAFSKGRAANVGLR